VNTETICLKMLVNLTAVMQNSKNCPAEIGEMSSNDYYYETPGYNVDFAIYVLNEFLCVLTAGMLLIFAQLAVNTATTSKLLVKYRLNVTCYKFNHVFAYSNCEYHGSSLTAIQAWRPCPLWEPSPSHPIALL